MPSKLQSYMQMADEAQRQITGSFRGWTSFLSTAARLYKYPYAEQVMIHAQRPDATACAEYDFWNEKMGRYVRRGSKGIALIDNSGERPRLRYVFDVSDTGRTERGRSPYLWELREEYKDAVSAMLENRYDVAGADRLADQLERIAAQLADEYWNDYKRDILAIVDDSFLYGYDDFNVGVAFCSAATVSITYSLMSRCGLDPESHFEHEDFLNIFDFNTPEAAAELGTAVSRISGQVLREIEVTIKNYEREKIAERSQSHDRDDLHEERGLPDSRPDADRDGGSKTAGQIRETAQELPSGAQTGTVQPSEPVGEVVPAPAGDRRDSEPETGAADAGADEAERSDGGAESPGSDEVGGPDEQPESAGRGNDPERAGVQLTADAPEPEPAQAQQVYQLSLFPSENEQIAWITEAESYTPSAFSMSIPQEDIDHILRMEGNADHARMMIATEFSKGKSTEKIADFLKNTFHGGNGIVTDNGRYAVWYAEDGIHIANGDASRYLNSAKVVSWHEAVERIGQLLEQGEYATNVELAEAPGHERVELAKSLWYLRGDLSEEANKQGYLSCLDEYRSGGFPDATARLAEALKDAAFHQTLKDEFAAFAAAYSQDKSLMRFRFHNQQKIWTQLSELPQKRREYRSDMADIPPVGRFITEDEISASLTRGSGIEGGKGRIYAYFREKHSSKEQADFLKREYGIGGRSHAVSGATHSGEDHSGKGIVLKKQDCPDVQMNWTNVAKRISELIRKDRFLTPEEKAQYDALQRQNTERNTGWNEYNAVKEAHPDDMVLYQVGDFFEMYGDDARHAAELLDLNLTTRNIPDAGRVAMCGIPANRLKQYVEDLRDKYDVIISAVDENSRERRTYTMRSIDHEADRATDAYEAEFGADGYRAFPGNRAEEEPDAFDVQAQLDKYLPIIRDAVEQDIRYRNACGHYDRENAAIECNAAVRRSILASGDMELIRSFSDMPEFRERLHQEAFEGTYERLYNLLRPLSQDDIDDALRAWNGDIKSKHAVVRYMRDHARDKDTASWLSREYGGDETKNLFISRAGNPEFAELTWAKVQRRISQLIEADDFYTDRERDDLDDVDPVAIREALAQRGIVNGELVDPAALERDPFIQQVTADAERIAQEEQEPALEQAKSLINDFCRSEYGDDADFSDLTKIGVAYTTVTDDEIPIQVNIDLVNYRLERYLDGEHLETWQYASMQELIANELESLDFSELAYVSDEEVEQYRFHEPAAEATETPFPYAVGDTVYLEDGKPFIIESIGTFDISLRDPTLFYPILRAESKENFARLMERFPQPEKAAPEPVTEEAETVPGYHTEIEAVYPAEETRLPYDVVIQTLHIDEPDPPAQNTPNDSAKPASSVLVANMPRTSPTLVEKIMAQEYQTPKPESFSKSPSPDDADRDSSLKPSAPSRWEQLTSRYPRSDAFSEGELKNCVRVEPRDFPRLRREGWNIAGNRFILHCFQRNAHCLIGRIGDTEQYVFAVPGIYDNQERFMANMFGFPCFKANDPNAPLTNGQKGYWYRALH